jgi:hypothetical protein
MTCPKTPFWFGYTCVEPCSILEHMLLKVFDNNLGAQGMEVICEL